MLYSKLHFNIYIYRTLHGSDGDFSSAMHCRFFDATRKGIHSSFLKTTVGGVQRPFRLKFALKVTHPPSKNADFDRFPVIT